MSVGDKAAIIVHCGKAPTTVNHVSAYATEGLWETLITWQLGCLLRVKADMKALRHVTSIVDVRAKVAH